MFANYSLSAPRALRSLMLVAAASLLLGGCSKKDAEKDEAPKPAEPAVGTAQGSEGASATGEAKLGLILGLARFEVENNQVTAKPLPARADFLYQKDGEWIMAGFEDADSNVFHKVMAYKGADGRESLLSFGGMGAFVKRWTLADGELKAETLWEEDFGGRWSRMRDAEIGDLYSDGKGAIAIATHDQGIVAILRDHGDRFELKKIDQEPNTFVHEIEIGDVDGDGILEVYATPSEPNRIGVDVQTGQVVRYIPQKDEGRKVVADLGNRHAKEIFVGDMDGDGKDELYVAVEAKTSGSGASLTIDEPVEIRRYEAGTPPDQGVVVATLPDRFTRFLTVGDPDGSGKKVMIAAAFRSGVWLLTPGDDPSEPWKVENIDRDSSGFEHTSLFADLDEDGKDELYVAADEQGEIRRYVWVDGEVKRETIYKREGPPRATLTWNMMPVAPRLVVGSP